MRKTLAASSLFSILVAGALWAQSGPGFGVQTVIDTAGAANTEFVQFRTAAGTLIPACFKFDTAPYWQAAGGTVILAYSMDRDLNFSGDVATDDGRRLNDTEIVRNSSSISLRMAPNERSHAGRGKVAYSQIYAAPGARAGLCTIPQPIPSGSTARFPCDASSDCTSDGLAGGTCEIIGNTAQASTLRERSGCAFALVQTDTAGAVIAGNP